METDRIRYDNNVIYAPPITQEPDARGIGYVYYEYMSRNKDLLAQLDGPSGVEDTYGALLRRCIRVAIAMGKRGVHYGDIISVCTYNHINSCVPHIASMFIGATVAAIDPSMSVKEASYLLRQVMPKLIFVQSDSLELVQSVIMNIGSDTSIVLFGPTETHIAFSDLLNPHAEESQFKPVTVRDIRDVAVILFSSGTTGMPKGICHTHYSILRSGASQLNHCTGDSLLFASGSPYWNVFLNYLNYSIQNGAARLLYPKFDLNDPWRIFNHTVTTVVLDITQLLAFIHVKKPEDVQTGSLGLVAVVGAYVSKEQYTKIQTIFPNAHVRINYGQTEIFPNILIFDVTNTKHLDLLRTKKNSCGFPKKGICYKIADEAGEALGPNEKGELLVKTDMQLSGYYNMDSRNIWDSDGWLRTGDYGYYDEDFCFFIIDRVKEMFKYRCWHIVPAVLEGILQTHPAVYRAVIIGIPHEVDNYHPMAVVQLKSSAKSVIAEEIEKYLEERVEDRQRLRGGVKFVKSYPITPSGKVNRMKLKNMILQKEI